MQGMELPQRGELCCFGQRQGYCDNRATWRMEGQHLILHFCDECKRRDNIVSLAESTRAEWIKLPTGRMN